MFKQISKELKIHAPFTIFGAITGIIIIALFQSFLSDIVFPLLFVKGTNWYD